MGRPGRLCYFEEGFVTLRKAFMHHVLCICNVLFIRFSMGLFMVSHSSVHRRAPSKLHGKAMNF